MVDKLVNRLRELQRDAPLIVIKTAEQNVFLIRSLNTFGQLFRGLDAQGEEIRPPYRPSTIERKRRKGQPSNRVTVKDTGRFYISITVIFSTTEFLIVSDDPKAEYLQRKYGNQLLGLNDESLQHLIDGIRDDFINNVRKFLFNDRSAND